MNHKHLATIGFTLVLLVLVTAACTPTSAATPCPTSDLLSCPTAAAQVCPTAPDCSTSEEKAPKSEGVWFSLLDLYTEIEITFEPGEKCSLSETRSHLGGLLRYHVKVNDQEHAAYAVIIQTVDEGKTLADLEAYPKTATSKPSWSHTVQEFFGTPDSNSYHSIKISEGPFYISCFVEGNNGPERIADFGPIEISK